MSPEHSATWQTLVMWVEHQMGKQRGSYSHRYFLNACYVPGIVLGSEDTVLNIDTKSLGHGLHGAYSLVRKHPLKKYNFLNIN